jgi:hypothetical protein
MAETAPHGMSNPLRSVAFTLLIGSALYGGKAHAQQLSTAPVRMEKSLPYVTCSIGSSAPLICLLDTGSAMTGVSRELAKQLKLKTHTDPTIPRRDIAAQALDGLNLRIGSTTWSAKRTSVAPADLELLDKEAGPGFHTDVVIGTELLEQYQITLDPDESEVRFSRPGTAPPISADKLMTSVFGIPFAPIGIKTAEGHAAIGIFSLDTGSRPALMLAAIRIAHTTMHHVVASRPTKGSGLLASEKLAGVIGGPILNHFVVIYDLPNKAVWMTPSQKDPPQ